MPNAFVSLLCVNLPDILFLLPLDTQFYAHIQAFISQLQSDAPLLLPEYCLIGTLLILVIASISKAGKQPVFPFAIALLGLVTTAVALYFTPYSHALINNTLHTDGYTFIAKLLVLAAGMFAFLLQWELQEKRTAEWYIMVFTLLVGAFFMISATHLLLMFLALEMVSIPSYILAGFRRKDAKSTEASLKYILFGAFSSATMLYGLSWIYGTTGTFHLSDPTFITHFNRLQELPQIFIFCLLFAGFLFKISAVPFHFWTPDVYEGMRYPTLSIFITIPKIAGFVMLAYLANQVFPTVLAQGGIIYILSLVAIASMTMGNFAALGQKNLKRLWAYSGIAHSGFMLLCILPITRLSHAALLFYLCIYVLMNMGVMALSAFLSQKTASDELSALHGQGQKFPLLTMAMSVFALALTGLPPTGGFIAKWFTFTAVWSKWETTHDTLWMVVLIAAVLNTIVSLFYYVRLPAIMVFKSADTPTFSLSKISASMIVLVTLLLVVSGILGFDTLLNAILRIAG